MSRLFLAIFTGVISFLFSYQTVFSTPGSEAEWVVDISNPSALDDQDNVISDSLQTYIFTAVVTEGDYVYTARSHKGPWTGTGGGSIQKWNAIDGSLILSDFACGCLGIYDLELKVYNGDGLGLVRLYVYKPGKLEIWDKDTLLPLAGADDINDATAPLCGTDCNIDTPSPDDAFDDSIAKRTKTRGDGTDVFAVQSGPNPINEMILYLGGSMIAIDTTWGTDIIPAPSWHIDPSSSRYFGVEAIALSPDHDYVYIVGGRENAGAYSSRMEKWYLGSLSAPAVTISSTPPSVPNGGGNITLNWNSVDADSCNITSSPSVWSGTGISGISPPIWISANTTFTADCTRTFDSTTGSDEVMVTITPNQAPVAVIGTPASDIAITIGTNVSFDGTSSYDSDGTIVAYEWRDGDCATGTLLSSAGTFSKNDFNLGSHPIYLTVQDNNGAWSNCALRTITMPPQCSNGVNDDTDAYIDFSGGDPGCVDENDNDENNCGNSICEKASGESFSSCRLDCKIIFKEN